MIMNSENYIQPLDIEDICPKVLKRYVAMRQ